MILVACAGRSCEADVSSSLAIDNGCQIDSGDKNRLRGLIDKDGKNRRLVQQANRVDAPVLQMYSQFACVRQARRRPAHFGDASIRAYRDVIPRWIARV